jgi:hypothetical protein
MEGSHPAVSGLTFTDRDADEKKFPALCRTTPTTVHQGRSSIEFRVRPALGQAAGKF